MAQPDGYYCPRLKPRKIMKRNLWIWIAGLGLALLLLPGCNTAGKNLTSFVKALANDPATVRLSYGPLIFERFVPATNIVAAPDLSLRLRHV